jgi:amidase
VQAYLARINEVNIKGPALRAIIEVNPFAVNQADALDSERRKFGSRSHLHGIPIILKDNIGTQYEDYGGANLFPYFPKIYGLPQV